MWVYSPPGSVPRGVDRNTEYPTDVARIGISSTAWARITLGPVRAQDSLVTLKMPAPIRMPTSAA
jgi:hypothetical protein